MNVSDFAVNQIERDHNRAIAGVLIEIGPILLFQTCTTTTKWRRLERTLVHWSGSTPRLTGPLVCPENRLGVGGEMVLRRAA
ncbi:hypothetical protein pipiens_014960, partial [Culex pipiens pipiens]